MASTPPKAALDISAEQSEFDYDINASTYDWCARIFRIVKRLLSVNLKLHDSEGLVEKGTIFVFNHFARFETFIPQYLIYEEIGAYCCSIAHSDFFKGDETIANFLYSIGAIPHDHKQLFSLLAVQIMRGRKVIIFPEGGMVKDRQVVDKKGRYSVFSRSASNRRKQHTGAAVLALAVDIFKTAIKEAERTGQTEKLQKWTAQLKFKDTDELLVAAHKPTIIIPSNITFYPIRVSDNILRKGAELLNQGLNRRHSEELLIEGNILLEDTDMDVRLGKPVYPTQCWRWWEKQLIARIAGQVDSLGEVFALRESEQRDRRILANAIRRNAKCIRNEYMHNMYAATTVNMSHLASSIIIQSMAQGETRISRDRLHKALYLAVKCIQKTSSIFLHRSLRNPECYSDLIRGTNEGLEQFLYMAETSELIEPCGDHYSFLPKLQKEFDFDEIRMENLVAVYANEIAPLPAVTDAVKKALKHVDSIDPRDWALFQFDDEVVSWRWDKDYFSKPSFDDINKRETATQSGEPFLLRPAYENGVGVLLAHGLLASPAEMRGLGEKLVKHGYTVLGVRLKGHGTSPRDLREKRWEDWLDSLRRGYEILQTFSERICLVGFSTGGALALRYAADQPDELAGVVAISVPMKFRDAGMMLVPLMHGANTLVQWILSYHGIKSFIVNKSEHPDINYRHIPIRALYELRQLIDRLSARLKDVHCPVLIIQSTQDPVVDPQSAELIYKRLSSQIKTLHVVQAERHGILFEDIGRTQEVILSFLDNCAAAQLAYSPYQKALQTLNKLRIQNR